MARTALHFEDYRPLRKGEAGYSSTKRLYVSPSTGDVISLRQFQTRAREQQPLVPKVKEKKERAERIDKGMTRKDYARFRDQLKQFQLDKKRKKKRATKDLGLKRYNSAKKNHIKRINKEREDVNLPAYDDSYEPQEPEFYDYYDVIKHPDNYTGDELASAYDYFWGEDYADEYDYDYFFGETP